MKKCLHLREETLLLNDLDEIDASSESYYTRDNPHLALFFSPANIQLFPQTQCFAIPINQLK